MKKARKSRLHYSAHTSEFCEATQTSQTGYAILASLAQCLIPPYTFTSPCSESSLREKAASRVLLFLLHHFLVTAASHLLGLCCLSTAHLAQLTAPWHQAIGCIALLGVDLQKSHQSPAKPAQLGPSVRQAAKTRAIFLQPHQKCSFSWLGHFTTCKKRMLNSGQFLLTATNQSD